VPGCPVTIGDVTFDWEPSTPAGVAMTMSGRGTDMRLDSPERVGADERKRARASRRAHLSDAELAAGAHYASDHELDDPER
jgi:GTPase